MPLRELSDVGARSPRPLWIPVYTGMTLTRGAGDVLLPGELGVSPNFPKSPNAWGI